jgi:hypothetical protein
MTTPSPRVNSADDFRKEWERLRSLHSKPRYRYWESETHPRWRSAWVLVGALAEFIYRARTGRGVPIMLRVKGGER